MPVTYKEIIPLKKAGITGRVQNPGLCFVYLADKIKVR